jgi:hypothetical protein
VSRADSTLVAVAAGVGVFALTLLCASFLEWPVLTYVPRQHAWRVLTHAPAGAMQFYGLFLWAFVAGVDASVVGHAVARSLHGRALSGTAHAVMSGWVLVSLLLSSGFFVLRYWPRG